MTDSDEDIPLGQRNQAFLFGKAKPIVLSSDDDSPLPSWLDAPKPDANATGTAAITTDSDSDIKEVISPPKLLSPSKNAAAATQTTQPTTQGDTAGPSAPATQETAAVEVKEEDDKAAPASAGKGKKAPTPKKKGATPKKAAAGAASQPPGGRSGLGGSSSSVPVMLPDRLTQAKVLLELETGGDAPHGATDLSGDSGAIGRVIVSGQGSSRQLQIDLKGVLYNATVVPAPVTMAVVNIGPSEAKVEALFDEFVQLREDARFAETMGAGAFGGLLDDDDDDEDHFGGDGDGDGGAPGKKETKKKGAGRGRGGGAAGGGAARKTAAARKPRGGGVKKPAARGRGKAKK